MEEKSRKIMIVDDETAVCESVSNYFTKRNFEVITANSSEEALLKLQSYKPDLILLDIYLPMMNGIECLKRIKHLYADMKVIMVTCVDAEDIAKSAIELGAIDYITKPMTLETLELAITTHLFFNY